MTPKVTCKLCAQGHKPSNGEHWIVKSVSPAKIVIKPCADAPKREPAS